MAFTLDNIVVDRIQYGVATDVADTKLLYVLTELQNGQVQISADSKQARDAQGNLVKKFWQGKSGTFTATNAMVNLNVIGSQSGEGIQKLKENDAFVGIHTGKSGEVVKTTGIVEGSAKVHELLKNGTMGDDVTASCTVDTAAGTVTLPAKSGVEKKYIIEYSRTAKADSAIVLRNRADKFPATIRLVLKVLAIDTCSPDTLRAGYLVLPSFQPSPEVNFELQTQSTLDYTGDLQISLCSDEKVLYEFYWAEDDTEDAE